MARPGRRLTVTLSLVLVALIVVGAGAAYAVGRGQRLADGATGSPMAESSHGTTGAGHAGGGGSENSVIPDADASAGGGAAAGPTSAGDTSAPQGPVQVSLSPSAEAVPQARDVADLLSWYFTAINRHDYDAWLTTVSTAQAKRSRDDWTTDYSTTHDSDIYVSDITPGDPLTVRMQFTSHQAVEFAPKNLPKTCVRWDVTYHIVDEGVGLKVGNSAKPPAMADC